MKKKKKIHDTYKKLFNDIEILELQTEKRKNVSASFWLNLLHFKDHSFRNKKKIEVIKYFKSKNIETRPFWQPLSLMKHLDNYERSELDNSITLWKNSLMIPSCISIKVKELSGKKCNLDFVS